MKRFLILLILLLTLSLFIFAEKFYLTDGRIITGSLIDYQKEIFTVKVGENAVEILKKDIVKIEISKEIFNYNFDMINDFKNWKIGGRRENGSMIYVDKVDKQKWLRIHKDGYTENNIYMDFKLPYSNNTNVYFSSDIMGFTAKFLKLSKEKYAIAGIIFIILDENKKEISRKAYAWGTNAYPFEKHEWINRLYASVYKPFEVDFNISDMTNKKAKYLRIVFWTFCSSNDKELSADLWVKNVKLKLSYKK
ncbi:hypothetical protein SAMN02745164_01717 [Marinitoga hydrogenitolerans DSM 16785]|uniref:Uncharacterized protein n=1 Tax=Marinitoga hydrogenitolerans (strain DSM 16785 / JCM 12826 / AT1271) TaxID=1122195 RepID=A0A1M4YN35_MARH1|nr:hypothetical protein [Marinitoga hydrogenitolerans]SHF07047.1 hypothetical protein SAMN02745164_01717 [Marinitoga hydrogenitolerans DSM 16785]